MKKKILVDMSCTLIHNGHVEILKKARKLGEVIVALTTDKEIKKKKGYIPELNYKQRSRVLSSIKYVDRVIPSKWDIDDKFIKKFKIDVLVHGKDNSNSAKNITKKIVNRTEGVSSSQLRYKAHKIYKRLYEKK